MLARISTPMTRTSNSDIVQLDQINYISVKPGQHFQKPHSSTFVDLEVHITLKCNRTPFQETLEVCLISLQSPNLQRDLNAKVSEVSVGDR